MQVRRFADCLRDLIPTDALESIDNLDKLHNQITDFFILSERDDSRAEMEKAVVHIVKSILEVDPENDRDYMKECIEFLKFMANFIGKEGYQVYGMIQHLLDATKPFYRENAELYSEIAEHFTDKILPNLLKLLRKKQTWNLIMSISEAFYRLLTHWKHGSRVDEILKSSSDFIPHLAKFLEKGGANKKNPKEIGRLVSRFMVILVQRNYNTVIGTHIWSIARTLWIWSRGDEFQKIGLLALEDLASSGNDFIKLELMNYVRTEGLLEKIFNQAIQGQIKVENLAPARALFQLASCTRNIPEQILPLGRQLLEVHNNNTDVCDMLCDCLIGLREETGLHFLESVMNHDTMSVTNALFIRKAYAALAIHPKLFMFLTRFLLNNCSVQAYRDILRDYYDENDIPSTLQERYKLVETVKEFMEVIENAQYFNEVRSLIMKTIIADDNMVLIEQLFVSVMTMNPDFATEVLPKVIYKTEYEIKERDIKKMIEAEHSERVFKCISSILTRIDETLFRNLIETGMITRNVPKYVAECVNEFVLCQNYNVDDKSTCPRPPDSVCSDTKGLDLLIRLLLTAENREVIDLEIAMLLQQLCTCITSADTKETKNKIYENLLDVIESELKLAKEQFGDDDSYEMNLIEFLERFLRCVGQADVIQDWGEQILINEGEKRIVLKLQCLRENSSIHVNQRDNVKRLKEQLTNIRPEIVPESLVLSHDNMKLDDDMKISDLQLNDGACIIYECTKYRPKPKKYKPLAIKLQSKFNLMTMCHKHLKDPRKGKTAWGLMKLLPADDEVVENLDLDVEEIINILRERQISKYEFRFHLRRLDCGIYSEFVEGFCKDKGIETLLEKFSEFDSAFLADRFSRIFDSEQVKELPIKKILSWCWDRLTMNDDEVADGVIRTMERAEKRAEDVFYEHLQSQFDALVSVICNTKYATRAIRFIRKMKNVGEFVDHLIDAVDIMTLLDRDCDDMTRFFCELPIDTTHLDEKCRNILRRRETNSEMTTRLMKFMCQCKCESHESVRVMVRKSLDFCDEELLGMSVERARTRKVDITEIIEDLWDSEYHSYHRRSDSGAVGLRSHQNGCCFNAIIQQLSGIKPFLIEMLQQKLKAGTLESEAQKMFSWLLTANIKWYDISKEWKWDSCCLCDSDHKDPHSVFEDLISRFGCTDIFVGEEQKGNAYVEFLTIPLTVKGQDSLVAAMEQYWGEGHAIRRAPLVLTFQLADKSRLKFPMELDLERFMVAGSTQETSYRLRGVIAHTGEVSSGHYVTITRRCNQWVHCDDMTTTIYDPARIADDYFGGKDNSHAYMLFYERVDIDSIASDSDPSEYIPEQHAMNIMRHNKQMMLICDPMFSYVIESHNMVLILDYFFKVVRYWQERFMEVIDAVASLMSDRDGCNMFLEYVKEHVDYTELLEDSSITDDMKDGLCDLFSKALKDGEYATAMSTSTSILQKLAEKGKFTKYHARLLHELHEFVQHIDDRGMDAQGNDWPMACIAMVKRRKDAEEFNFTHVLKILKVCHDVMPAEHAIGLSEDLNSCQDVLRKSANEDFTDLMDKLSEYLKNEEYRTKYAVSETLTRMTIIKRVKDLMKDKGYQKIAEGYYVLFRDIILSDQSVAKMECKEITEDLLSKEPKCREKITENLFKMIDKWIHCDQDLECFCEILGSVLCMKEGEGFEQVFRLFETCTSKCNDNAMLQCGRLLLKYPSTILRNKFNTIARMSLEKTTQYDVTFHPRLFEVGRELRAESLCGPLFLEVVRNSLMDSNEYLMHEAKVAQCAYDLRPAEVGPVIYDVFSQMKDGKVTPKLIKITELMTDYGNLIGICNLILKWFGGISQKECISPLVSLLRILTKRLSLSFQPWDLLNLSDTSKLFDLIQRDLQEDEFQVIKEFVGLLATNNRSYRIALIDAANLTDFDDPKLKQRIIELLRQLKRR